MTAAEILRKASELPWTQGEFARDADGNGLFDREPGAVCWCADGAIRHVGSAVRMMERVAARNALRDVIGTYDIHEWNDAPGRTAEEVAAKMIEAAELLERGHG